ncbi:MAG: InlB B-repeat-containing protein, partial [Bacteroidales bacterium]|nr:InlB B-repeat-containing protein [Bacteroidales bacterium]
MAWMDGDKTVSTQANYTFDMPAEPLTYTAKFRPTVHNVTVLIKPDREAGTVSGEGNHKENTDVTLTATPKNGYRFKAWMNGDAELSKDNPYTFTMPTLDVTYSAAFEPLYTLTLDRTPGGTVTGANSYGAGDKVTIEATPESDYTFVAWMNGDKELSKDNPYTFDMPAQNTAYKAVFEANAPDPETFHVMLNMTPNGAGTVSGEATYKEGDKVSITATANENYAFVAWKDGDQVVSTEASHTFDMPAKNVTYTAEFRSLIHNLTLNILPGREAGNTTGGGSFKEGTQVSVTATANDGYRFVAWMDGDTELSKDNPYKFEMPAQNTTYEAVFEPLYALSLLATPENAGIVTGNGQYA